MQTAVKKNIWILFCSAGLFAALFIATYPFFRYYVDPDAVNYLTIARRYASHDYSRAINGLWSPFSSWLVALCIGQGMDALFAAQIINAIACIAIIVCTFIFLSRYKVDHFILAALMFVLPIALIDNLYEQLFCDLWQVFFLLCYLMLVTSEGFLKSIWKWVLCGIIATLAYFAKAYSFYFIIIHLPFSVLLLVRKEGRPFVSVVKAVFTILITMLVLIAPWLYLLHQKYEKWMLSSAGILNHSWFLTGHKTFKAGITELIPPAYNDSPWNMEDPLLNSGHIYSVWEQPKFLFIQAGRSAYAFVQGLYVMNEISILLFSVLVVTSIYVFTSKEQTLFNVKHKIFLWASFIMPLGYLLMHFESRYIWLLGYTGMVLGAVWLLKLKEYFSIRVYKLIVLIFALSYLVYPVYDMKSLFNKGKDRYMEAEAIKETGIKGSFTSNGDPIWEGVTAYLTGMPYYTIEDTELGAKELLAEMKRYHVNYYIFHCRPSDAAYVIFKDESGKAFPEINSDKIQGIKIFLVNP